MERNLVLSAIAGVVITLVAGCGGSSDEVGGSAGTTQQAYTPRIKPASFTTRIDNRYFPLKPGTTFAYQGKSQNAPERDVMAVTHRTKQIMGVKCVVVDDRVFENGKLTEQTYDWYAQDKKGNVWYFGEDSRELKNGKVTSTKGSWETGKDGAKPGIIMQAHPKVGKSYHQEYYKGKAEDMARTLKLNGSTSVPYGSFKHVLVTREWSPLEPNVAEHKYYAPGVGDILEVTTKGPPERLKLVSVRHG